MEAISTLLLAAQPFARLWAGWRLGKRRKIGQVIAGYAGAAVPKFLPLQIPPKELRSAC